MTFSKLPEELQQHPHWVLWKNEQRNGRSTKIPYQVNGCRADVTTPTTWTSFKNVCETYAVSGLYNGVGYVFSIDDPYTGIDIDNCITAGKLSKEATNIVNKMKSYTEYSQSSSGIHILVRAAKLGNKSRTGNIEIYDHNRFFVMTGNHLTETPLTIEHRQTELDSLYNSLFPQSEYIRATVPDDQEIITLASQAKNGKKFLKLYQGDTKAYGNDDSAADLALCNMLAFWTKNPLQIDRIFRASGLMREKWNRLDYRERTILKALNSKLTEKKTPISREGLSKTHTYTISENQEYALTDLGNSKRFIDQCGNLCRFVYPFHEWYLWNESYWEKDQNGGIMRIAKKVAEDITNKSIGESEAIVRHAKKSESLAAMKNMIDLSKSELHIDPDKLDQHHWLLNVRNGTIDLKTGHLLPPNQKHYLTQISTIEYYPGAAAPLWDQFLLKIMGNNEELVHFLQKAVGYSITGSVSEQVIFFLHGDGRNGKSTFLNILAILLGSYAKTLLAKSLMVKKSEGANNDIAELKGSRFIITSEGEQGQQLAEALVKKLTGGDRRKARFLFGEYFEYEPTDKIWFMTNHKPVIKGKDNGIWRRILVIPFNVSIPAKEQDKDLKEKLLDELPGILNWAVEGCLMYQKEGLTPPTEALVAQENYRREMDTISSFINDCYIDDVLEKTRLSLVYVRYQQWCRDKGICALSTRQMQQQLKDRGYETIHYTGNQVYLLGLRLK